MAQLDPFINLMFERRADGLQMVAGRPISLTARGAVQPASKTALTEGQILGIVRELAPSEVAPLVSPSALVSFVYHAPGGAVAVELQPTGEGLTAHLRPAGAGAAGVTAGAASAAAAPTSAVPAAGNGQGATVQGRAADAGARAAMEQLFTQLVASGGSDLHLRSGEPPIIRRHGELVRQDAPPIPAERLEALLLAIMDERVIHEFAEMGDADWAYELGDEARFRCNAGRDRFGPFAVFRIIPTKVMSAEEMGLSPQVQQLCYLTKGLVVVTGPTGSGKSTTLAAMVDLINRTRTDHILTIEDPIEFVHQSRKCLVTQRQVGVHTKGFKQALRAALREDPDVILVGEMRDLETVSIAIETAETGHLVFGTLHTTTAASTVDRIIDQFPADRQSQVRVMLSESLKGVIAQTLCKKIGGGRVAAREILLAIPAISNLIREGKTFQIPSIMQTNKKAGMITLNDALMELVDKGLVEPQEAYMKSVEKSGIVAALKAKRFDTSFLGEA
ncbi:MAG TPA: type IV pilus twitching motility protein PilT [Gemmatimonadales bacterium]|nr:type IV pilus twitching motility protein PilT [Gemmatimonadales bacterium]